MENSIVPISENVRRSVCAASVSKSIGSLVQIESIAVELNAAKEQIEMPVHEHFSIRGYVAGMRNKDLLRCFPFASDNLPPLSVPSFRWWKCSHCVPESRTSSNSQKVMLEDASKADTNICLHNDGKKMESLIAVHDSVKAYGTGDGTTNDSCTYESEAVGDIPKENTQSDFPNSSPRPKEGHNSTSFFSEQEGGNPSSHITEVRPCQIEERQTHSAGTIEYEETDIVGPNPLTVDEDDAGKEVEISDKAGNSELPVLAIDDDEESVSSENDDSLVRVPRRRKPKLRSLNDIMEDEKLAAPTEAQVTSKRSLSGPQHLSGVFGKLRTLQKKRKSIHEEDGPERKTIHKEDGTGRKTIHKEDRPVGATHKTSAGNKLKATPVDGGRDRISDFRPEEDASAGFQEKNAQHVRPRKSKGLDGSKRKIQKDDGRITVDMETVGLAAWQKRHAQKDTNVSQSVHVPVSSEQVAADFRNYPSGKQKEQVGTDSRNYQSGEQIEQSSSLSNNTRMGVRIDEGPIAPPISWTPGVYNAIGNGILDPTHSVFKVPGKTGNSESLPGEERCIQERGVQRKGLALDLNETLPDETALSEGNNLASLEKDLDMPATSINETATKRQGNPGLLLSSSKNSDETTAEDIPMEIVELLANNLHERTAGNSRNHLHNGGSSRTTKGSMIWNSPVVEIRGNGPTITSKSARTEENNQINFYPFNKSQPFSSNQQGRSSIPVSDPILERPGEGSKYMWPPRSDRFPGELSDPQHHANKHSFPSKGRTISDIKSREDRVATFGMHLKQGKVGPTQKPMVGPSDHYQKDPIPAMQLLSWMDRGLISGSGFNIGANPVYYPGESSRRHSSYFQGQISSRTREQQGSLFEVFPGQYQRDKGPSMPVNVETSRNLMTSWAQGRRTEVCVTNRNPADFSFPHAGNKHMISAKDLEVRKRNPLKVMTTPRSSVDGRKRHKGGNAETGKVKK